MHWNEFVNPAKEYRDVTLWMLNDELETDELKRQLREIHDKGFGAVIARTFIGLRTEYLGDAFMDRMQSIVDLAEELGMKVFFQAGYMPSGIPEQPPASAYVAVSAVPRGEPVENGQVLCTDETYQYAEVRELPVLDMFSRDAVGRYLAGAYEQTWFAQFGDQFGKTISSIWVDEPHFNPPQIPWGDVLQAEFEKEWGYRIDEHIPSLFTDTGDANRVRHHYWRTVTRLLLNGYFEEVFRWCEEHGVSFSGHLMGEDTLPAQIAFTGACMPLYEKMQLPGIDHLTLSLNWSHWKKEGEPWRFVMTPKQCSSAAHQFGRKQVLAEMYGVSSQGITFEDQKQIADWFFIHGINVRCFHGFFYSMRGRRKRIHVPHLSYQQPWWKHNRLAIDYGSRMSYLMQQGRFCADVLVLHPVESAYGHFTSPPMKSDCTPATDFSPELEALNESFSMLSERLMQIHCGFEYGDEHIMAGHGSIAGGMIRIGDMSYKTVVLPDCVTLRQRTVDLLTEFIGQGGTVLAAGRLPQRIDGEEHPDLRALTDRFTVVENSEEALAEALHTACPPRITVTPRQGDASQIFIHERELEDGTVMVLCVHTDRENGASIRLGFHQQAGIEELMCVDGTQRTHASVQRDVAAMDLDFAPLESRLLLFKPQEELVARAPVEEATRPVAEISEWNIHRKTPNALALDYARLRKGAGAFSDRIPISAIQGLLQDEDPYEGPITLQCEFEVAAVPGFIAAVIEDADQATIRINGTRVHYAGLDYYCDPSFLPVELTPHVVSGTNVLEVDLDFKPLREPEFVLNRLFAHVEGSEVESMVLIGDFAVSCSRSQKKPLRDENVRYAPAFVISGEPATVSGDLIESGYPFFAGEMELSADVALDTVRTGERYRLKLPGLESCVAEIAVNGEKAGKLAWKPYGIDITDAVRPGDNRITVTLTNTLRNLLGPHHRPLVERQYNWGFNDYTGGVSEATNTAYPDWYTHRNRDTDAWTEDYFFVRFGLYQPANIVALRAG